MSEYDGVEVFHKRRQRDRALDLAERLIRCLERLVAEKERRNE